MTKTEVVFCTIQTPKQITENRVRELLCCALEGGSNYWYTNLDCRLREGLQYEDFQVGGSQTLSEYWHPFELIPFVEGCSLTFQVDNAETDLFKVYNIHLLNRAAMERGIKLMAEKYPDHFNDFMEEDDDAITGDVFLQLSLFGELIYG